MIMTRLGILLEIESFCFFLFTFHIPKDDESCPFSGCVKHMGVCKVDYSLYFLIRCQGYNS